jgi:hypothetical protein
MNGIFVVFHKTMKNHKCIDHCTMLRHMTHIFYLIEKSILVNSFCFELGFDQKINDSESANTAIFAISNIFN